MCRFRRLGFCKNVTIIGFQSILKYLNCFSKMVLFARPTRFRRRFYFRFFVKTY
jgi:hypothetical protein